MTRVHSLKFCVVLLSLYCECRPVLETGSADELPRRTRGRGPRVVCRARPLSASAQFVWCGG
jgi:hypothetical protein